jgi:hypothetical protein
LSKLTEDNKIEELKNGGKVDKEEGEEETLFNSSSANLLPFKNPIHSNLFRNQTN